MAVAAVNVDAARAHAELHAESRDLILALCVEVQRLEAEVERIQEQIDQEDSPS